jgi:hypothetical protein
MPSRQFRRHQVAIFRGAGPSQIRPRAPQGFVESRLRLFSNEAGDIASDLIAMTLRQQQKRVNRTAKKAVM